MLEGILDMPLCYSFLSFTGKKLKRELRKFADKHDAAASRIFKMASLEHASAWYGLAGQSACLLNTRSVQPPAAFGQYVTELLCVQW